MWTSIMEVSLAQIAAPVLIAVVVSVVSAWITAQNRSNAATTRIGQRVDYFHSELERLEKSVDVAAEMRITLERVTSDLRHISENLARQGALISKLFDRLDEHRDQINLLHRRGGVDE